MYSVGLTHAYLADFGGNSARLVRADTLLAELWGHPSADGQWVYFGGYDQDFKGAPYRIHPDGSALQLVPAFQNDGIIQAHPSPSPDGTRVAYFREALGSRNTVMRVLNMATGSFSALDVPGHSPEWSHGDTIGYIYAGNNAYGPIRVMASNGTGIRTVTRAGYELGITWAPNDRFIAARNASTGMIDIVEVSTGKTAPLSWLGPSFYDPAWRP
ncbi:MAG TPA: hypothetical protein VFE05_00845 [Longimicrobiaceae bacterium]|jgi:hypothetical protein|nr:hypothetical protein [Longimicrobiaceae bacterium]